MAQYWSTFQTADPDGEIPDGLPDGRYVAVIPSGHGALTAWVAGPRRCYRTPYPAAAHPPIRVTRGHPGRTPAEVWFEPYTEADLKDENDDINSYLAEAGVRLRPHGYRWHVLVPEHIEDGEALESALREKNKYVDPVEVYAAVKELYEMMQKGIPPTLSHYDHE
ncbi:hypothetical protein BH92_06195 [Rhodococcoides fascians A21d2]|uniref:DUF5956 family protein n=1 Tax=Rhodococcoides fascians TaxID=1828 RepID=UPI00068B6493|nr:DUF5956 family protein [Rhodococcus fascians]QIH99510.1 hypothetical protein BH92_06195 [Rhodococcus fascians A21d2]